MVCVCVCVYIYIYPKIITVINPLNTELNPICQLLALLETHHILHVSSLRVKSTDLTTDLQISSHNTIFYALHTHENGLKNKFTRRIKSTKRSLH